MSLDKKIRITVDYEGVRESVSIPVGDLRECLTDLTPYHGIPPEVEIVSILEQNILSDFGVPWLSTYFEPKSKRLLRRALAGIVEKLVKEIHD